MSHGMRALQVKQLGDLGLMGVAISEEHGGTGLDYLVRHPCRDDPIDQPRSTSSNIGYV